MKFCKNLQRVVDLSDPEWAPFWTNYKMLKVRNKRLVQAATTKTTTLRLLIGVSQRRERLVDVRCCCFCCLFRQRCSGRDLCIFPVRDFG